MTDNAERKPPYSAQEVADTLGISKSTVIEAAKSRELDSYSASGPAGSSRVPQSTKRCRGKSSVFTANAGAAVSKPRPHPNLGDQFMRRHEAYPSRYTKAGDVEKPTVATITTVGHETMQDGKTKPCINY